MTTKTGATSDSGKFQRFIPLSIWMIISYKGVRYIKWTSSKSWINGKYYRNNVLAKHVLTDKRLKHDSYHGSMFQHDRVTGYMATAT
jgi:hypothetical protein